MTTKTDQIKWEDPPQIYEVQETLGVTRHDVGPGYQIVEAKVAHAFDVASKVRMEIAFTHDGYFLGGPEWADRLIVQRGLSQLQPRPRYPGEDPIKPGTPCSIGFCEKDQKWYGWSHRAICGFGIGYVAEKGHCCTEPGLVDDYVKQHPESDQSVPVGFEVKTLDDAKRCATAFAASVS